MNTPIFSTMGRALFIFLIFCCFVLAVTAVKRPRGVSLEKASFYQDGNSFHCLSDGKRIDVEHVNDDYCDCEDGSDEPGTSACPNGLFHCENTGFRGNYVKSSRVNDGICDCCDGSDEYDGSISCPNSCAEKFEQERAQKEKLRLNQEEGYKVKQEYMQQGKRAKDEKLSKLSELESEKEILTREKETAEASKNAAEEPEKAAIDEHKKAWDLVKEERKKVSEAEAAGKAFATLDVNGDGKVDYPELMKHKEFDIDSDGTVSEEEAKEYLEEYEEVDLAMFTEKIWPNIKEIYKHEEEEQAGTETHEPKGDSEEPAPDVAKEEVKDPDVGEVAPPEDIPLDVMEGGSPEDHGMEGGRVEEEEDFDRDNEEDINDDEEEEDEDDEDAAYDIKKLEALEHAKARIFELERMGDNLNEESLDKKRKLMEEMQKLGEIWKNTTDKLDADTPDEEKEPDYNDETKALIAAADAERNTFNEAERKLQDNEREISDIKKYLELDLGPNQEFAALKGECFEYTDREYTYRLCPFDKSTQKSKNGGMETSLGTWGKWHGPDEDKYDTMKYENGQGCWNGPARSTHVNLHCGSINAVTSASEPSRCEYQFEFTTPARCETPKSEDMTDVHDEL